MYSRLATSYIAYLMSVLETPQSAPVQAFKAELVKKSETKEERRRKEAEVVTQYQNIIYIYVYIYKWLCI